MATGHGGSKMAAPIAGRHGDGAASRAGVAVAHGSAPAAEVTRGGAAMKPAVDEMFPEGAGPYVDLDEVRGVLRCRWRGCGATARRRSAAAFAGRGKHGAADGFGRQRESGAR